MVTLGRGLTDVLPAVKSAIATASNVFGVTPASRLLEVHQD